MTGASRYIDLLQLLCERMRDAPALLAPGMTPVSYRALYGQIERVAGVLAGCGFQPSDRIAIVLPNGPRMAICFLAVSSCATSAPLNPAYSESEFEFYLSDLAAKAILVPAGVETAAVRVARRRGIRIIEVIPGDTAEGDILRLQPAGTLGAPRWAEADDTALVLHTSGTTSRPKIVPLTHANIVRSAVAIGRSLELSAADRCLNVMPLFHIHGLIGALLSSLLAGGSVVCTPGFDAAQFLPWLEQFKPSWYTAVPTIHQAATQLAAKNRDLISQHRLRFIRSCSSALPPKLMTDMEDAFGAPVVEAYGMTEASHQMSTNPLPPRERKPGSVGLPAGPEVGVMDENGNLLGPGQPGEIVIRGASVTRGYENNAAANDAAFTNGWFRTGDRGFVDEAGYIFLAGRIKEMINRGGEKISPREIDEVLLAHPEVAQALAFSLPHPTLGEDVAAAIVLREGATATGNDIRIFAGQKLAPFKVPRRIVIVPEIPKGPTGKPQRIGLDKKLGLAPSAGYVSPRNPLERTLSDLWSQVLGTPEIGIHDDFFELGGDSITATQVASRLRDALQLELAPTAFFEHPTIAGLSALLEGPPAEAPGVAGA